MAQGSRIYHGRMALSDVDGDRYLQLEASTALHPSESIDRLVLRLLAWLLLHEEGMTFRGGGVSQGDEPDLAVREADGRLLHWIDVGTPSATRLEKAARTARVSVVTHEALLPRWKRQHGGHLPEFGGRILVLETGLVTALAEALPRRFRWQATITGGTLYLDDGNLSLAGRLYELP
ncbi:MAG TPA: hypothetical protein ENK54_08060 [Thiotrichales bacterium]|nr:hypothetical protein [Thiotrichales bacterium]